MSRHSPPKKYHKSGTPIDGKPNPRAGIIKGPTVRYKPRPKSPPPPQNPYDNFGYDPYATPPPEQDKQGIHGWKKFSSWANEESVENDPNGTRLRAEYNPNETDKIERYLASDDQNILLVKKIDVIAPVYNPPALSSQLKAKQQLEDEAYEDADVQIYEDDHPTHCSKEHIENEPVCTKQHYDPNTPKYKSQGGTYNSDVEHEPWYQEKMKRMKENPLEYWGNISRSSSEKSFDSNGEPREAANGESASATGEQDSANGESHDVHKEPDHANEP